MTLIEKKNTRTVSAKSRDYVARLARTPGDICRAQRLRFEVFNLELNEGLAESHFTGLDADPFDTVCDHLIVEQVSSGNVVGTYRLQTGETAQRNIGYYSEREFDFGPYESVRSQMIELGRACVHADHRTFNVLHLLWRSIASYARERRGRYLVGCSSLTSQDPGEGRSLYNELARKYLVEPALRTVPCEAFAVARDSDHGKAGASLREISRIVGRSGEASQSDQSGSPRPVTAGASAKLLRAYLMIGGRICGPPALDREFGTIDFLTLLDLHTLPAMVTAHFFR
jgi:putative hemolysin